MFIEMEPNSLKYYQMSLAVRSKASVLEKNGNSVSEVACQAIASNIDRSALPCSVRGLVQQVDPGSSITQKLKAQLFKRISLDWKQKLINMSLAGPIPKIQLLLDRKAQPTSEEIFLTIQAAINLDISEDHLISQFVHWMVADFANIHNLTYSVVDPKTNHALDEWIIKIAKTQTELGHKDITDELRQKFFDPQISHIFKIFYIVEHVNLVVIKNQFAEKSEIFMVGYPFKTGPKNDQSYIVFHPAMLKEILALLFPDTYLNPIPVLGQRNIETFSNDNERIVSLVMNPSLPPPNPGKILPLPFYLHDGIHCIFDSSNPFRSFYNALGKKLRVAANNQNNSSELKFALEFASAQAIDKISSQYFYLKNIYQPFPRRGLQSFLNELITESYFQIDPATDHSAIAIHSKDPNFRNTLETIITRQIIDCIHTSKGNERLLDTLAETDFSEDESWYRASVVPMREIIQAVKSVKSGDASIIQPT